MESEELSSQEDTTGAPSKEIAGRLWSAVTTKVPLGYEDETGFHLGTSGRRTLMLVNTMDFAVRSCWHRGFACGAVRTAFLWPRHSSKRLSEGV